MPQKLPGGRAGRARAYVIMADRLQFHLEAGTLPAEAAEHVRHAQDALMKAICRPKTCRKREGVYAGNSG
jgi:hypothetical protein